MILYLSSNAHTNLLDFTELYGDDSEIPIKKMVGSFVLKQFIVYDMRNFSHFSDVVLDRIAFGDTDMEFAEAIEEFLTMYNARITVIYEGLNRDNPLFSDLLNIGVGNIVNSVEIKGIQAEILECISKNGMKRYEVKERIKPKGIDEQYCFDCENICIAVIGSISRIGATTTAMGLAGWLHSVGATTAYVEMNSNKHLPILIRDYEIEKTESGYVLDGVTYCMGKDEVNANFVICDIGTDFEQHLQFLQSADIIIMLCGTKPYELPYGIKLKTLFQTIPAFICIPFLDNNYQDTYAEALQSDYHKVLFLEYQPDLMNYSPNKKNYKNIVDKYIAGAQCSG